MPEPADGDPNPNNDKGTVPPARKPKARQATKTPAKAPTGKPMGRPTVIDAVIATRKDPTTGQDIDVTVADRIIAGLRNGTPEAGVAAAATIEISTYRGWMKHGGEIQRKLQAGAINRAALSQSERRLADFFLAATRAVGEWETATNAELERIGRGGREIKVITRKVDEKGNVVETTERIEHAPPNPNVMIQRLKMRLPDRYMDRTEVTGAEGGPVSIEVRVAEVLSRVAQIRARAELPPGDSRTG